MAKIRFANGTVVNFDGNPTPSDVEEVAIKVGLSTEELLTPSTTTEPPLGPLLKAPPIKEAGLDIMAPTWEGAKNTIMSGIRPVINTLTNPLTSIRDAATAAKLIYDTLTNPAYGPGVVAGATTDLAKGIGTGIKEAVSSPIETLKSIPEGIYRASQEQPLLTAMSAQGVGKLAGIKDPIHSIATPIITGVKNITGGVSNAISGLAKYATSQATGLNPQTVDQIVNNPAAFSKDTQALVNRQSLANKVKNALDEKIDNLSETGAEYNPIRASNTPVDVPSSVLDDLIKENAGVTIKGGKIISSGSSVIRESRDVSALQNLYNTYKPIFDNGRITPNEFLNLRQDIAKNLAKFGRDVGKSTALESISKKMYSKINDLIRPKIEGLSNLDDSFSAQIQSLDELKAGILDRSGDLTDVAINKIANATGAGKTNILSQLEKINPGITHQIRILKAIEDIENASGIKVGTYARAGAATVAGYGLLSGDKNATIGAVIAAILTSPSVAVPLLRQLGFAKEIVKPVLERLSVAGAVINNSPSLLITGEIPVGLSTIDVTKLPPETQRLLKMKGIK